MAKKRTAKEREEAALDKVQKLVKIEDLEAAADAVEELADIGEDLRVLRAKVLALEGITSTLCYGDKRSLFDLAEELCLVMTESLEPLRKVANVLDKVTLLDPKITEDKFEDDEESKVE